MKDNRRLAGGEPKYIGRYRAERVVGSGAFATVWLAEDETLAAPVAIKVLAENWAHDDEVRQRFLEEARILWRADSDHIVRIHNVDQLPDGRPYFVMDFADRGTLHDRMRGRIQNGGRYTIDEAIAISLWIADGLKVAHALGVVHRDLKPANIMFQSVPVHHGDTRDEKLILTDFGMAKSVARSRGTTIATGTPYYMAPEQTEGRADERSDIYSAGVVLYELLAGRVPYPYDSPGRLFAAQVAEPPARITSLRDDVPPALDETLHRALSSDPDRRWSSAEAWSDALTAAAKADAPVPAPLPGVDPDVMRTMGPAEIAAAKAAEEQAAAAAAAEPAAPAVAAGAVAAGAVAAGGAAAAEAGTGAAAAPPPPPPPPPTPPPAPASADGAGSRKRKRALAIGGPIALVVVGVVAAVLAIVVTGSKTADAKTLTLDPISALGRNPFTPSVVPRLGTPVSSLQIPTDLRARIPAQLIGQTQPTDISQSDLVAKLAPIYTALLRNLNPAIGALSNLKLPLSVGLKNTSNGRPRTFTGTAPGLYGGTQLLTVCDKRAMIAFLERNTDKLGAWAAVQGISPSDVASYISNLTDVVLQFDTRVTNHGYIDGKANDIDEVLQHGTAVLIDEYGIPRARCYCGNPLTPPRKLASNPKIVGKRWPGFSVGKTVDPVKAKKAPEFGAIDVVTGTTAVYKKPGATPGETTLTPQLIPPLPGSTPAPPVSTTTTTTPTVTTPTVTTPTVTAPPPPPPPPPPRRDRRHLVRDGRRVLDVLGPVPGLCRGRRQPRHLLVLGRLQGRRYVDLHVDVRARRDRRRPHHDLLELAEQQRVDPERLHLHEHQGRRPARRHPHRYADRAVSVDQRHGQPRTRRRHGSPPAHPPHEPGLRRFRRAAGVRPRDHVCPELRDTVLRAQRRRRRSPRQGPAREGEGLLQHDLHDGDRHRRIQRLGRPGQRRDLGQPGDGTLRGPGRRHGGRSRGSAVVRDRSRLPLSQVSGRSYGPARSRA